MSKIFCTETYNIFELRFRSARSFFLPELAVYYIIINENYLSAGK